MSEDAGGQNVAQSSDLFGMPGYKIVALASGGLLLTRPDGSTVFGFDSSMPEGAVKRIAKQDAICQGLFREALMSLMVDLDRYLALRVNLDLELLKLLRLVQGGAINEEFQPGARGIAGRGRSGRR